jgi:hypothetical protein
LRRLRAVTRAADAGVSTDGSSTARAWCNSCVVDERSAFAEFSCVWRMSLSVEETFGSLIAASRSLMPFSWLEICELKLAIFSTA